MKGRCVPSSIKDDEEVSTRRGRQGDVDEEAA
jgi:hypothetical protein